MSFDIPINMLNEDRERGPPVATILELLPAYKDYRRSTQNRSGSTIKNDDVSVRILATAAGDIDPRNIKPPHIDKLVKLLSEGMSTSTYNTRLSGVKAFMLWCRRRGHVGKDFDPVAELTYRKDVKPDRHRLPVSQFFPLLDAATHPRDRILAAFGLWMFLRVSEVRALRMKDVDLQAGELHVYIQKTNEYDIMPISSQVDAELRRWLSFYTQNAADVDCGHPDCGPLCVDWYLVPARHSNGFSRAADTGHFLANPQSKLAPDRPLGKATGHETVQRMLLSVGFRVEQEGMHTLRRSGARAYFDSLVDSGFDGALKRVSSMLHHASVTMTERYLGIREDRHTRNRDIKASVMFPGIEVPSGVVVPLRQSSGA